MRIAWVLSTDSNSGIAVVRKSRHEVELTFVWGGFKLVENGRLSTRQPRPS